MQTRLLARETGHVPPHEFARAVATDLIRTYAPAPHHRFHGGDALTAHPTAVDADGAPTIRAHGAGVSALAVDHFDGRLLLSGGADGSLKIWDLAAPSSRPAPHTFRPAATVARASPDPSSGSPTAVGRRGGGHTHGVTHLAFYPFDPDAFLSSSFDRTLRLWSTARAALSASFRLDAGTVHAHATSPVAHRLLVACATQHAHVRLVDLRSGAAVHALVADGGPVLAVGWSPRREHVLVSGHADGRVRLWDVRRPGRAALAQLDQEDALGTVAASSRDHGDNYQQRPLFRATARAHDDAVNAVQFSDDGRYLVTAGLDRRIRVWDADTGANTLAGFGALVQNRHPARAPGLLVAPRGLLSRGVGGGGSSSSDVLIWANDQEMLVLDMHQGTVLTRLRSGPPRHRRPPTTNPVRGRVAAAAAETGRGDRITSVAWRAPSSLGPLYSAHLDGRVRAWTVTPPGPDDDGVDDEDDLPGLDRDEETRRRKRKAVDDAYRSLMGKQITFT